MENFTAPTPLNVLLPVTEFVENQTSGVGPNITGSNPGFNSAMQKFQSIVLPSIYSVVCIIGLIGNALVIYIMHLKVRNRNITDLYVLNLAIADFIFVAMLPFWASVLAMNNRWVFGKFLCKFTSGSTYFHMYASVFFLTAMSVDRFLAVVMYQSCRRTKMTATIGVIAIWLLSTMLGLLPMFFRDVVEDKYTGMLRCDWTFDANAASHTGWFLTYFISRSVLGFMIPFIIILVSYSLIIIFLKRRETRGKLTSKCQDRATRMVLVVIAVFLLCWLPNQISNLIYVAQSLEIMSIPSNPLPHYYIHMFSTCLAWMHSCINPILYAFMREDMRLKLTEIMNYNIKRCCGDRHQNNGASQLTAEERSLRRKITEANKRNSDGGRAAGYQSGRSSVTESLRGRRHSRDKSSSSSRRSTATRKQYRLTTIGHRRPNGDSGIEEEEILGQVDHNFNCSSTDEESKSASVDRSLSSSSRVVPRGCMPSPILEESRSRSTENDVIRDAVTVHDDQDGVTTHLESDCASENLL